MTVIRVAAGAAALVKLYDLLPVALGLAAPGAFRAPVLGSAAYPPEAAIWWLAAVWATASVLLCVGFKERASAGVLAGLSVAALGLDWQLYSNHLYLLTLVMLVWAAAPRDARLPSLRWLVSIMYGFAAAAKVNLVYLSGATLAAELGHGSLLPFPDALRVVWLLAPLALLSIVAEAFLALGLWSPRHRSAAVVVGVLLHGGILLFFSATAGIVVFTVLSLALYVAFFDRQAGAEAASATTAADAVGGAGPLSRG